MDSARLRQRMSDAARERVLHRYTIGHMVQGYLDATRLVDGVERFVET